MDNRMDDLWRGGPWEQPNPVFPTPPAVIIPAHAMKLSSTRPVLRPKRRARKWPAFFALLSLILGLCLLTVALKDLSGPAFSFQLPDPYGHYESNFDEEVSTEPPTIPLADTGTGVTVGLIPHTGVPLTWTDIYEKSVPSIVSIEAEDAEGYSTGTGVVLTQDGYIITNAHVVAGAELVQVVFSDNNVLPASLVGFNATEDLAVLKVEATNLTPAEFGDSSKLRCGDPVAAIGDPLGYRSTITDGVISALDRDVSVDDVTMVLIQTSAAINFGNSGGALINQYGQVVGITTIKIVTEDGAAEALGFAIPSARVKYVVDALIDGQEIRSAVFGFTLITRHISGGGLEIQSVHPNSDAYEKGIQAGDIIISANGLPITATQDLSRLKLSMGPGDGVLLTYLRDGEPHTVEIALVDSEQIQYGLLPHAAPQP